MSIVFTSILALTAGGAIPTAPVLAGGSTVEERVVAAGTAAGEPGVRRAVSKGATDEAFVVTRLQSPRFGAVHVLRDANGDRTLDLFELSGAGVAVRLLGADGRYSTSPDARAPWPGDRVGWDVGDTDGDGRSEVLALVPDRGVVAYALDAEGAFGEPRLVLEESPWLPPGAVQVDFVRDVNGDGREDLVVPAVRSHRIHVQAEDGTWAAPLDIAFEAAVSLEVGDPRRLDSRFGRAVTIPWFTVRDIDGDGHLDLVSETEDRVDFHLATEGTLPPNPTWSLDIAGLRAELPRTRGVNLDDLLDNAPDLVEWQVADLDGAPPAELILAVGSRIRIYTGGARTGPRETPDQILKATGKLLGFFVRDVLDDPRPELQLMRGERISLGRALRYLILPGRLDFEVFTYANEAGLFGRRPARHGTFGLEIPRLLTFINEAKELSETIDVQFEIPARRIAFGPDGVPNDVVDLVGDSLVVTENCAPDTIALEGLLDGEPEFTELLEKIVLEELDKRGDEGLFVIDIGELDRYQFAPGAALRASATGRPPAAQAPFGPLGYTGLRPLDLDGDGRDDIVAWGRAEGEKDHWEIGLFVRRR